MIEDATSRSHTTAVGSRISKSCLENAAPSWTEAIPASTSHTGRDPNERRFVVRRPEVCSEAGPEVGAGVTRRG